MTPAEISHAIRSFDLTRKQFAELVGYPSQTIDRWCAPGPNQGPAPPAAIALLLILQDMPEDARQATFSLLASHDLRGSFRPLTKPAAPAPAADPAPAEPPTSPDPAYTR